MDLQAFVDCCSVPCAVLSVERNDDGSCGQVRIERSNQVYKDVMGPAYYDGMPYEELVPKDAKFEDFCFRAAFLGQRMHAYVPTKALGTWTDQIMVPLQPASPRLGYCQFLFEFTQTADPSRMASVSMDTATAVIKASITLLGAEDFVGAVREVLGDIISISGAYGSRVMLVDHEACMASNFCERICSDVDLKTLSVDAVIPYEVVKTWDDMIGESNAVIVKDARDMACIEAYNAEWVASMRAYGVTSLVLMPLRHNKHTIGYLYVTNFDPERVVEVKELLELMSYILGSEISNYLLMNRLEELSNVDALTGLYNRNAMINRMGKLVTECRGTPFGIINMDLNGLKAVNDTLGHDAGDRLLVEAAELLQKLFYKEDLYRTGGDEFIAMIIGIERDVFERKLERLRCAIDKNGTVSIAFGSVWSDGSMDVRVAFQRADVNMYKNKRDYYRTHPGTRGR